MSVAGIFTWWREATIGTKLFTWAKGEVVGKDRYGNTYYREKGIEVRKARRWVIYDGDIEASKVPPEWHAWLHKTVDEVPVDAGPAAPWQTEHSANVTGTEHAYRPPGHPSLGGRRAAATGDYEPWTPS
jgi:NADH:ubiquinone oxidoreductase subunit